MSLLHAVSCRGGEIPPCVFEPPQGYTVLGGNQRDNNLRGDEEEDLLQFAIQQSLLEAGSEYDQVRLTLAPHRDNCHLKTWLVSIKEHKGKWK